MNGPSAAIAFVVLAATQPLRPGVPGPHASHTGTLVVRWTIGGRASSDACEQVRAATVEIDVHEQSSSVEVVSLAPPCKAFSATAALPDGSYMILAVPEDDRGHSVSVPMEDRVAIEAGSSRTVSFNFPFSAVARHAEVFP